MKKENEKLNEAISFPLLEERKSNQKRVKFKVKRKFRTRKEIYRKWSFVFSATLMTTLLCVILLLLFGVNSNGKRLADGIADKISGIFADMDFPFFSQKQEFPQVPTADSENINTLPSTENPSISDTQKPAENVSSNGNGIYDFDYSQVPEGHTPIIPMDLSLSQYGASYINNTTGYKPNVPALLNKDLTPNNNYQPLSVSKGPLVLIVHTHATEAYSEDGAISCPEGEEDIRTSDTSKNVVSVGKTIADVLNQEGVPTAHCTIMHDSIQYKDSYARAEETIKKYLAEYPTIKLVIDIHRDSIIKSSGEIVRPVTELDGKSSAQIMCVVGSEWEGSKYPNWENNLSLALKLRELLNSECSNICRPVFLKSHTYNQEFAPYSLLLEVGASGNSLEEAQRSATLIAQKIVELMKEI